MNFHGMVIVKFRPHKAEPRAEEEMKKTVAGLSPCNVKLLESPAS